MMNSTAEWVIKKKTSVNWKMECYTLYNLKREGKNKPQGSVTLSLSLDFYNRVSKFGLLIKNRHLPLYFWKLGSPKSSHCQIQCLMRANFLDQR